MYCMSVRVCEVGEVRMCGVGAVRGCDVAQETDKNKTEKE